MQTNKNTDNKYEELTKYLKELGNAVIAFSGGVDSTFLLKVLKDCLGDRVLAITVISPYIPKWELEEAVNYAKELGVRHEFVEVGIPKDILTNPIDRCYLCKSFIFNKIIQKASMEGFDYVLDGTNFDDLDDYRPGLKALKELEIKSPLLECGLGKKEIRELSNRMQLSTWNKPPYACLLTRIPHDTVIEEKVLEKIEKAERILMKRGIPEIRVRAHGNLARIEVAPEKRLKFFDMDFMDEISRELKKIGFQYVTLDLEGYRTGSLTGKTYLEEDSNE
ncbi:ATP-dependent sacrificial sulfur transferase LarE [Mobilitalea sibirica]|uniref:ATP-dependent sacrificial sulfur transferase LarE n=1 Tax=Mobilitalea sibirica TaxID=1462919 RepID=A0A8J7HBE9_9FIRM|nr:ATP-dependent sacrificial sulfur transferase LarE [Mobilitalea sibirica]